MAWPYSGNWNGLNVTQLPEIMAALARAHNERLSVLNTSYGTLPTFTTVNGQKTYPSASDFYGMEINGELMDTFRTEIDTRIRWLLGRSTFNSNNVYHASYYSGTTLVPLSVGSATDILPADIKPTALCANFWLRLKDICNGATLFKIFLRNPTISSNTNLQSSLYSDPDTAWTNINDSTASSGTGVLWRTSGSVEIGTTNKLYQATQRDDINFTYTGTGILAGSVIDGRLFTSSQVISTLNQDVHTELKNPTDFIIGGQTFTVPVDNTGFFISGANIHSLAYTGWSLGSSSSFSLASAETPTDSPFTGSKTQNEGTELETTLTSLGELNVSLSELSGFLTPQDYIFSSINPFLVLDISSLLTDQT